MSPLALGLRRLGHSIISFFRDPSPAPEDDAAEMFEFYDRARRDAPKPTGIPAPINIQVEERNIVTGRFADNNPPASPEVLDDSVSSPPPPGITGVNPNVVTWQGGTTVTITGENFISGATVKIAGVAATGVTFIDSTHISCVTPSHDAGFVPVEVTNPSGQPASLDNAIRYTVMPDNFLLSGYQLVDGYQLCVNGHTYPYTLTPRLGTAPFKAHPSNPFYATLGIVGRGNLCHGITFSCFFPYYIQFNNYDSTIGRPVTAFFAKDDDSPGNLGPNGFVDHAVFLATSPIGILGQRLPLYGDAVFQPSHYRIVIDPNAPPPSGTPPSTEFFIFVDIGQPSNEGPWSWVSGSSHTIRIQCLHANGTLHTGYNGTASITVNKLTPPEFGTLTVSPDLSAVFSGGQATIGVRATFSLLPNNGPQGSGQFSLFAVDGPIQGTSPIGDVLNHL